jgi:hypothetical protein
VGQGQWGIIINRPGDSVASFDDANIIGSITISGTGIVDLYNAVHVEFPHIDLDDQRDYVRYEIPIEDRNENEPDNTLQIQYDILNDPVQAGLLGAIELKQSRIDKVVKFITDYSRLGLKAGQIIDITSDIYGFVNKKFRIVTLVENDGDDGSITLEITASEYDPNVYNASDLVRYYRTTSTGIPTIGALGIPGTPEVSNFQSNARPHFVATSTAPTGTVEGMEFWYTTDVPPAITVDTNRAYQFLDTIKPTTGNTFEYGSTVSLDWDRFNDTSFLIKTRAVNSSTTGPFSQPSGKIVYVPEQITNTIDQNTKTKDASGLGTILGVLSLLKLLDKLFSGTTGPNLAVTSSQRIGVWKPAKISGTAANTYTNTTVISTQVLPYTGGYKLTSSLNWGGSDEPGLLVQKYVTIYINGNTAVSYPSNWQGTGTGGGAVGSDLYEDQFFTTVFSANANTIISVDLEHYCSYLPYAIFPTFDLEYVGNVRTS